MKYKFLGFQQRSQRKKQVLEIKKNIYILKLATPWCLLNYCLTLLWTSRKAWQLWLCCSPFLIPEKGQNKRRTNSKNRDFKSFLSTRSTTFYVKKKYKLKYRLFFFIKRKLFNLKHRELFPLRFKLKFQWFL